MIAPNRSGRPGAGAERIPDATPQELEECPFCAGREDRTPPEVLRVGEPWRVRVVPNLYPAFEWQEVVIHSPRHARSLAELTDDELAAVAHAWHDRAQEAWVRGFAYTHVFVNEGAAAGSSLPHSHSQIVWLREQPPEVRAEAPYVREEGCPLCVLGAQRELQVAAREGVRLHVAAAGRAPYEMVVAPTEHGPAGEDSVVFLERALSLLREGIRRLRAVEGAVPWNAWLHEGGHRHLHVVPRLTVFAGVELGAGIYVNPLAPEDAAAALRAALL